MTFEISKAQLFLVSTAFLIVLFLVGGIGFIYAHGGDASLIHGCISNGGQLRIVDANTNCKANETSLDWNIQGPAGSPGPAGAGGFIDKNLSNKSGVAWGWATYRDFVDFNFSNTNFGGSDFGYSNLTNSNWSNVINTGGGLSHVTAIGVSFINTNISSSVLNNGDFTNSNFTQANLSGADVSNANFTNTNFTNTNLQGAAGFQSANTTGVTWSNTTCPDSTNSNSNGDTCVGHF